MPDDEFTISRMESAVLADLIPLHRAAFEGSLGVALGTRYTSAFLNWFMVNSEAINIGCVKNNRLIGYAFGAPQGYASDLNHDLFQIILLSILTHPWLIFRTGFFSQIPGRVKSLLGRSQMPRQEDTHSIFRLVGIGTDPQFRRLGIARILVAAFENEVWNRGFSEIRLSVYRDNLAALALYESCGWKIATTDNHRASVTMSSKKDS